MLVCRMVQRLANVGSAGGRATARRGRADMAGARRMAASRIDRDNRAAENVTGRAVTPQAQHRWPAARTSG